MPHLLVAGSTGTGKTIFLNNLILNLLYQNSPEILRFILIDPKRVEFSAYRDLPHLLAPVIFDAQRAVNALHWLISEMERRFDILSGNGSRNIDSYNEKVLKEGEEPLPYIVLIIDELADLMAAKGREVEVGIVRLAQMARAVGIHLVVATQRPSVEVITGLIKANITSRITFQVASQIDSRTVIDTAGAEKLLGMGDLLFISAEITKPKRIQGAYVSEKEVKKVVNWIKGEVKSEELKTVDGIFENHLAQDLEKSLEGRKEEGFESFDEKDDPLYEEARRLVIESRKASASLLQRRLRIGYARAARLLDMLEDQGVVGPGEGAKPREVYTQRETPLPEQQTELDEEDGWRKV
jgi:S-DNA-T family DNA segregation ATPase FtsK/SpoIIIE